MMCIICRFQCELDDVVVRSGLHCVCYRCYLREAGESRPMPKELRREVSAVLEGAPGL